MIRTIFFLLVFFFSNFFHFSYAAEIKPDPSKGQQLASQTCAACHALDGNSPGAANPKIAGQLPEYFYKQLVDFKPGKDKQPAVRPSVMAIYAAPLSETAMQDLAAYFALQTPKLSSAKNKNLTPLGQKVYRWGNPKTNVPACAACHGVNGAGLPAQYPRLAGQFAEYTESQLKAFRSGERKNDPSKVMQTIAAKMTDQEIKAVSDYIAGLR